MKYLRYLSVVIAIVLFSACNPSQIMTLNKNSGLWKSKKTSDYQYTMQVYMGNHRLPSLVPIFEGLQVTIKNEVPVKASVVSEDESLFGSTDVYQHLNSLLSFIVLDSIDSILTTDESLATLANLGRSENGIASFLESNSVLRLAVDGLNIIFPSTERKAEEYAEQYSLDEDELQGLKIFLRTRNFFNALFGMDAQFNLLLTLMMLPSEGADDKVKDISYDPVFGYPSSYTLQEPIKLASSSNLHFMLRVEITDFKSLTAANDDVPGE